MPARMSSTEQIQPKVCLRHVLLACGAYAAITFVFFRPMVLRITTHLLSADQFVVPGKGGDEQAFYWVLVVSEGPVERTRYSALRLGLFALGGYVMARQWRRLFAATLTLVLVLLFENRDTAGHFRENGEVLFEDAEVILLKLTEYERVPNSSAQ
jgi:hypothetical protein